MNLQFDVDGSPRSISDQVEQFARALGNVTALIVPWESSATTLSMAVTAVKSDGWAIEHTNLGTITLTAAGDATRVAIVGHDLDHEHKASLAALFDRFARDVQERLGTR
jgi:hypothetical protein